MRVSSPAELERGEERRVYSSVAKVEGGLRKPSRLNGQEYYQEISTFV